MRIEFLWNKARRYINKLMLQARLQKMAEQNMREMMIDEINEDDEEENEIVENDQPRIKWYLIDTERNFCKAWDFLITLLTIYNLIVVPIVLVFPEIYIGESNTLVKIEVGIDIIYFLEILFCFVKKTLGN